MQLNNLVRKTPNYKSASVGRGGKRGKTSGRGTKGQNARAGRKKRPEIRDFIKRVPKLRGYAFKSFQERPVIITLDQLEKAFKAGDSVKPETIVKAGLASKSEGSFPIIKILADGEIAKKIVVSGCRVSASAKAKIEKAGGKVNA